MNPVRQVAWNQVLRCHTRRLSPEIETRLDHVDPFKYGHGRRRLHETAGPGRIKIGVDLASECRQDHDDSKQESPASLPQCTLP